MDRSIQPASKRAQRKIFPPPITITTSTDFFCNAATFQARNFKNSGSIPYQSSHWSASQESFNKTRFGVCQYFFIEMQLKK
jgi:hypothetical protein